MLYDALEAVKCRFNDTGTYPLRPTKCEPVQNGSSSAGNAHNNNRLIFFECFKCSLVGFIKANDIIFLAQIYIVTVKIFLFSLCIGKIKKSKFSIKKPVILMDIISVSIVSLDAGIHLNSLQLVGCKSMCKYVDRFCLVVRRCLKVTNS